MRPDTTFRIASLSKPIAGAVTMILAEEGRIQLDVPVDHWFRSWPDAGC